MPKVCLEDGLRVVRGRAAAGHFTVGPGHEVLALKADEMIGRGAFCGDADRMTGPVAFMGVIGLRRASSSPSSNALEIFARSWGVAICTD